MKTVEELLDFYNVEVGKEYKITFADEEKLVGRKFVISNDYGNEFFNFYLKIYKNDIDEDNIIYKSLSLLSEIDYKEVKNKILNSKEKEYLGSVIKPFKDMIISITKSHEGSDDNEFIYIKYREIIKYHGIDETGGMFFPYFSKGTMYKNMEINKEYTLEELGL